MKVDRKVLGLLLAAAAAFCSMSVSASAAPAATPPSQGPKPAAAQQKVRPLDLGPVIRPTDDPAKVAAAKQFIMLYHPNTDPKNINRAVEAYLPRAVAAARKDDPKLDVKKFEREKRQHFLDNGARLLNNQAHVVSRHFTLQELKDMSAFFGSTLGRKLTSEAPRITQEIRMARREEMKKRAAASKDSDDDDDDDEDDDAKSPSKAPAKPPAKPTMPKSK
ncbi:MAG TPA: DUF2059 domain-containing protein [Rhizomicrobium sp.]|nr:DUF2059 domain-containing protein [Rhizomicrobium sp.]